MLLLSLFCIYVLLSRCPHYTPSIRPVVIYRGVIIVHYQALVRSKYAIEVKNDFIMIPSGLGYVSATN